jgi:oligopeptide transport system substrate-binding protein
MRRRSRSTQLLALLLGVSLFTAACGGDDDDDGGSGDESASQDLSGACQPPDEAAGDSADSETTESTEASDASETTESTEGGEDSDTSDTSAEDDTSTTEAAAPAPATQAATVQAVRGAAPEQDVPQGGELVDIGTFPEGAPEHIDPALNVTLDAYQVINAMYDGLTDIDASDPENPQIVGQVAESWESSDDLVTWTFHIRDGLTFSDGSPILPSTFKDSWERASDPDFAGDYSYLFNFLQGGAEKLAGDADEISGVVADDDAMTLTTTLSAPYANWAWIAGFQLFMPVPEGALENPADWENGDMVGNGPFMLEEPRSDEEIRLVPNPEWDGTVYDAALDLPADPHLDRLIFRIVADRNVGYNAFEAGEAQVGPIPEGRFAEAAENYGTTTDIRTLGSYHFELCWTDPVTGGPDNVKLRQAISQAINRDEINEVVWDGMFFLNPGLTPAGIPGYQEGLCEFCDFDLEAAQAALDEWEADGNELPDEPLRILFNSGSYHTDVVDLIVDQVAEIGIELEPVEVDTETYFTQLADGACNNFCRSGWIADYATYDNFMYDLFHTDAIGGNNHGMYSNPEFDRLVDQAKATADEAQRDDLFHQAEQLLLNDDIAVIPIAQYVGDYVYDEDTVVGFTQTPFQLIPYERVGVNS